jgi:hypothetical protein
MIHREQFGGQGPAYAGSPASPHAKQNRTSSLPRKCLLGLTFLGETGLPGVAKSGHAARTRASHQGVRHGGCIAHFHVRGWPHRAINVSEPFLNKGEEK